MSKEDVKFTRSIYHFPNIGSQYNLFGIPVLLNTEVYNSISAADNYKHNNNYIIVGNCTAVTFTFGVTSPLFNHVGYMSEMTIKAKVDGGAERNYKAFQKVYGRISPFALSTIKEIINGVSDIAVAVSGGMKEVLKHIVSLVTLDGAWEEIDNQPIPMHHAGVIRIDENLKGKTKEGGAATGRRSVLSDVDVRYIMDICTESYVEMLTARNLWYAFLLLSQAERHRQLKLFADFVKARQSFIERRSSGRLGIGEKMPNPLTDLSVGGCSPWLMWAWKRQLDQTVPPPDNRKMPHPGIYVIKRNWNV